MSTEIKSDRQFLTKLQQNVINDGIMVVFFFLHWCPYCQKVAPTFEEISKQGKRKRPTPISFYSVDIEKNPNVASLFGVTAGPTFLVLQGTKQLERIEGANLDALINTLNALQV